MGWGNRKTIQPCTRQHYPNYRDWAGPDDPDVRRTVSALLETGDIRGTDLVGWDSVEAGIRRNERRRLAGLLEETRARHADEDNYCTEADLSWDHAVSVVESEPR